MHRNISKKLNPDKPLISIITVVYNCEKYIEETILSVINQTYDNVEYIIIDGGSTDGTLDIIRKYEDRIVYWISEKDKGIYDAMNKGIDIATGQYLYFLGADDFFYSANTIEESLRYLIHEKPSLFFGSIVTDRHQRVNSRLTWMTLLHNTLHHQSCFYSNKLFEHFRYDLNFRIVADYELNLYSYLKKYPFIQTDQIIAVCRDGGLSTDKQNLHRVFDEMNSVRKKHLSFWMNLIFQSLYAIKGYLHTKVIQK